MGEGNNKFKNDLLLKIKNYTHLVYKATKGFPREEIYGLTSQWRRASMSIALNYTEGYSRFKIKVQLNFYETSYGSLKECEFIQEFSKDERLISEQEYNELQSSLLEIAKMLWTDIQNTKKLI